MCLSVCKLFLFTSCSNVLLFMCTCRILAVLHQQHHQPPVLRSVQRKLPAYLLAYTDMSLWQAWPPGGEAQRLRQRHLYHQIMKCGVQGFTLEMFTLLKLWIASARHNFKWVNIYSRHKRDTGPTLSQIGPTLSSRRARLCKSIAIVIHRIRHL